MNQYKPFIPKDKPKLWVICICIGLIGLGIGIVTFIFAWFGFETIKAIGTGLFALCWVTAAISGLACAIRLISGCYINLEEKTWSEQTW